METNDYSAKVSSIITNASPTGSDPLQLQLEAANKEVSKLRDALSAAQTEAHLMRCAVRALAKMVDVNAAW